MSVDLTLEGLCLVVEDAIKIASKTDNLSQSITVDSQMGNPKEWDSLSFVAVFTSVGSTYGIELEYDDAIHFRDIRAMHSLLLEIIE